HVDEVTNPTANGAGAALSAPLSSAAQQPSGDFPKAGSRLNSSNLVGILGSQGVANPGASALDRNPLIPSVGSAPSQGLHISNLAGQTASLSNLPGIVGSAP